MCKCWAVCGPWILAAENVSILAKSVKPWQILTFFYSEESFWGEKQKCYSFFKCYILTI